MLCDYVQMKLGGILRESAVSHLTIQVGKEQPADAVISPSTHAACRRGASEAREFAQGCYVPPGLKCLALELHFLGSVKMWHVGDEAGVWEEMKDSEAQRLMQAENMELSADEAIHHPPLESPFGSSSAVSI